MWNQNGGPPPRATPYDMQDYGHARHNPAPQQPLQTTQPLLQHQHAGGAASFSTYQGHAQDMHHALPQPPPSHHHSSINGSVNAYPLQPHPTHTYQQRQPYHSQWGPNVMEAAPEEPPPEYQSRLAESFAGALLAKEEHLPSRLPIQCSLHIIDKHFGRGVYYFFIFERFILILNLVLTAIQLLWYVPAVSTLGLREAVEKQAWWVNGLPISYVWEWRAANSVTAAIALLVGPMYSLFARRMQRMHLQKLAAQGIQPEVRFNDEDPIMRYDEDGNIDTSSRYRGRCWFCCRRFRSYLVFVLMLGGQAALTWYYTQWRYASADTHPSMVTLPVALLASSVNFMFRKSANVLTAMEWHPTWAAYKKHKTAKIVLFQACNLCVVYSVREYSDVHCGSVELASQFFWLIFVDVFLMNIVELVGPVVWAHVRRIWTNKRGTRAGDADLMPQFDLADEYLELIARQFVIYMAATVFPAAPLFGALGCVIEYYVDKYKLLRVCAPPPRQQQTMRLMIIWVMSITAVLAFLLPNAGQLWVMLGISAAFDDNNFGVCSFPGQAA